MTGQQASIATDRVDQLVPPARGPLSVVALVACAFVVLALAAVAPASGALRPNLAITGSQDGSAGKGTGTWMYLIHNRGGTTATIESFDLGVPGVEIVDTVYAPNGPSPDPVPTHGPVPVSAGGDLQVRVSFTYDCARRGTTQHNSVRARGVTPIWYVVDLAGFDFGFTSLIDFACVTAG